MAANKQEYTIWGSMGNNQYQVKAAINTGTLFKAPWATTVSSQGSNKQEYTI